MPFYKQNKNTVEGETVMIHYLGLSELWWSLLRSSCDFEEFRVTVESSEEVESAVLSASGTELGLMSCDADHRNVSLQLVSTAWRSEGSVVESNWLDESSTLSSFLIHVSTERKKSSAHHLLHTLSCLWLWAVDVILSHGVKDPKYYKYENSVISHIYIILKPKEVMFNHFHTALFYTTVHSNHVCHVAKRKKWK